MSTLSQSTESRVVHRLRSVGIVPVLSADDPVQAEACCRALMAGGISCVEITFRTEAAAEAIRRTARIEGLFVGAGTVLTPEQARSAASAGAHFAVAPGTNETVIRACREMDLPFFPGVATPSEIERARSLGLRTLKVFPASTIGGVGFLKAVSAAYRDVTFIPTGGIDAASLGQYLALPCVIACGGSWLVAESLLRAGGFDEVERLAKQAAEIVRASA